MPVKTDEQGGCPVMTEADATTSQGMPWSEGHHWKLGGSGEGLLLYRFQRAWLAENLHFGLPPFRTVKLLLFISQEVNDILLEQPAWTNTESKVVPTTVLFS